MNESSLRQPASAGVFRLATERQAESAALARQAGLRVFTSDLAQAADKPALLTELGRQLGFPGWFGGNFDALDECLTDADWAGDGGCALFVSGTQLFAAAHVPEFATLIEVFRAASDYWRQENRPFWVFLDACPSDLAPPPEA